METKTFEIRDSGTFIPMLAVRLNPESEADRYLISRAGFGRDAENQGSYILLCRINGGGGSAFSDPYEWGSNTRTVPTAHEYIIKHWQNLPSGSVICVETILGERQIPKTSERLDHE